MFNILTDSMIRYKRDDGKIVKASLPQVYAALMSDIVASFPALRPHQRHAWHAFLVQLGAMAMHNAGLAAPPTDADEWRRIIRELTKDDFPDDEPWHLVVEDITKPAFMQPPSENWERFNNKDKNEWSRTPDALDMLDTARNHDLKDSVLEVANPEDWMFAFINMQTMNGQAGRGNYPISRMNSGDGSRTAFSITPSVRLGIHARRDMTTLLVRSQEILGEFPYRWNGLGLLWTKHWDGAKKEALPLSSLHPLYIEVCRIRRLCVDVDSDGQLYVVRAASAGRRVAADKNRGVVGDPWTLVDQSDPKGDKALTMQTNSFAYDRVANYLFNGEWRLPLLFRPNQSESNQSIDLIMRGIRRKKGGQTEGYYERIIPIRNKAKTAMMGGEGTQELGDIAKERMAEVEKVQRVLRHAIATFAAHGESNDIKTEHWNLARPRTDKLDEIVDTTFFDDLQDEFEADETERDDIRKQWLMNGKDGVVDHSRVILRQAEDSLPCPAIQRYRARVRADSVFEGKIRGNDGLPFLFETPEENKAWQSSNQTAQEQNPTEAQMTLFQ